jgi:hypothetical protein
VKRLGISLALLAALLCFAQTTNTLTVTIPSDVATDLAHAHTAEYADIKSRVSKLSQTLNEDTAPSTVQAMLQAGVASVIADKVQRYSPSDLPARQSGESDTALRNRYQAQVRSKLTVK